MDDKLPAQGKLLQYNNNVPEIWIDGDINFSHLGCFIYVEMDFLNS